MGPAAGSDAVERPVAAAGAMAMAEFRKNVDNLARVPVEITRRVLLAPLRGQIETLQREIGALRAQLDAIRDDTAHIRSEQASGRAEERSR